VGRGHGDGFGERAVPIHANDARVLADVAVARAALEAVTADDVALGGDEMTRSQSRHAVTDRLDLSSEFVPDHERRVDAALRPRAPAGDVVKGPLPPRRPP